MPPVKKYLDIQSVCGGGGLGVGRVGWGRRDCRAQCKGEGGR